MADIRDKLEDKDFRFLAETALPHRRDVEGLVLTMRQDREAFDSLLGADRVYQRLSTDPEMLVAVSPRLHFAVLLDRASRDLRTTSYTLERSRRQRLPVFDSHQVADLLADLSRREYLADMLASFSRVETYTVAYRVREGVWRRMRFNDMDIDGLIRYAAQADEKLRFAPYKRLADVCLFVSGIFPEHLDSPSRYAGSGSRPGFLGRRVRTQDEYRAEGERFYLLASHHEAARLLSMDQVLAELGERFIDAQKALSYVAHRFIWWDKRRFFGV
jgi:hypothetical protein